MPQYVILRENDRRVVNILAVGEKEAKVACRIIQSPEVPDLDPAVIALLAVDYFTPLGEPVPLAEFAVPQAAPPEAAVPQPQPLPAPPADHGGQAFRFGTRTGAAAAPEKA